MNQKSKEGQHTLYIKFTVFMSFLIALSIAGCLPARAVTTDKHDTAGIAECELMADETVSAAQVADAERVLSPAEVAPIPIYPNEKVTVFVIGGNGVGFTQSDEDGNLFEDPTLDEGLEISTQVYTNCAIVKITSESKDVRYFRIKNDDSEEDVIIRVLRVHE